MLAIVKGDTFQAGMDGRSSDINEPKYLSILPLLFEPRGAAAEFK